VLEVIAIVDICGVTKVNGTFKKMSRNLYTVELLNSTAPSNGAVDNCRLLINLNIF
jgi:hypothetical protein